MTHSHPAIFTAEPEDPVFAALAQHASAFSAYTHYPHHSGPECNHVTQQECRAFLVLVRTKPTTLLGAVAVLKYLADQIDEREWFPDLEGEPRFFRMMAQSLETLIGYRKVSP